MFSMSWDNLPLEFSHPVIGEIRGIAAGEMTIERARVKAGVNLAGALAGQGNNLCNSPHWGYVVSGSFKVSTPERSFSVHAGDTYYVEPGHSVEIIEDCETIDISP